MVVEGAGLVLAAGDVGLDPGFGQGLAAAAALNGQFEFGLFVKDLHCARRVACVVPQMALAAVAAEDQGPLAEHVL